MQKFIMEGGHGLESMLLRLLSMVYHHSRKLICSHKLNFTLKDIYNRAPPYHLLPSKGNKWLARFPDIQDRLLGTFQNIVPVLDFAISLNVQPHLSFLSSQVARYHFSILPGDP